MKTRHGRTLGCVVTLAISFGVVLGLIVMAVLFVLYRAGKQDDVIKKAYAAGTVCPTGGDARVTDLLLPIRQKHRVPAMAGLVLTSDGIRHAGAVGVRKIGEDVPATLQDLWHLGSDGKAMTATVLARLVEQGRLDWETSMAELFPDQAAGFHEEMKAVTPLHLLSHRAGLRENLPLALYLGDNAPELRLKALRKELARAPACEPGSETRYSNLGYILAGAVIEKVTGSTWEEVMAEQLFAPLDMRTAGFGGTGTPGQLDQPWGHGENGQSVSGNGPAMDNPPVMGPAGRVHCSIQDWARFIQDQLLGSQGEEALLTPGSYEALHTPPFGGDYALGWTVVERDWGGGTVFTHCGDNTMNFANVWVAPERDFAVLVCANRSGVFAASDEAVGALIDLHLSAGSE